MSRVTRAELAEESAVQKSLLQCLDLNGECHALQLRKGESATNCNRYIFCMPFKVHCPLSHLPLVENSSRKVSGPILVSAILTFYSHTLLRELLCLWTAWDALKTRTWSILVGLCHAAIVR